MNTTTKSPRALPHVWKRFWSLKRGDFFFLGKRRMMKSYVHFLGVFPACEAVELSCPRPYLREFVAPWTRVRTDVLIRDARPGGKSSDASPRCETQGDDYTRLPQPHSDNPVSGPTS